MKTILYNLTGIIFGKKLNYCSMSYIRVTELHAIEISVGYVLPSCGGT